MIASLSSLACITQALANFSLRHRLISRALCECFMDVSFRLWRVACGSFVSSVLSAGTGLAGDYVGSIVAVLAQSIVVPDEDVACGAAICVGQLTHDCSVELVPYYATVMPLCDAFEVSAAAWRVLLILPQTVACCCCLKRAADAG